MDSTVAPYACLYLRVVLAGVALWAAAAKLLHIPSFRKAVEGYELLPKWAEGTVTILIPVLELSACAALLSGKFVAGGASLLLVLLVLFTAAILINLMAGRTEIACGCFGMTQRISWFMVFRNLALTIMTTFTIIASYARHTFTQSRWLSAATVMAGLCTLGAAALINSVSSLQANMRRIGASKI